MSATDKTITIPIPMSASGDKPVTARQWRWYAEVEEVQGNRANAALMRSVADAIEEQA